MTGSIGLPGSDHRTPCNCCMAVLTDSDCHPCRWDPIKTAKTSFLGTLNMLGLAKRCRARFLISSTSEVYGDPLEHPQTETYWGNVNPIGERSCYDEGRSGVPPPYTLCAPL